MFLIHNKSVTLEYYIKLLQLKHRFHLVSPKEQKLSLPGTLTPNISIKMGNCFNRRSHCFFVQNKWLAPQNVQTKCNKHCHVILHMEVEFWSLGSQSCETVLGGNYTKSISGQTLAQFFQTKPTFQPFLMRIKYFISIIVYAHVLLDKNVSASIEVIHFLCAF